MSINDTGLLETVAHMFRNTTTTGCSRHRRYCHGRDLGTSMPWVLPSAEGLSYFCGKHDIPTLLLILPKNRKSCLDSDEKPREFSWRVLGFWRASRFAGPENWSMLFFCRGDDQPIRARTSASTSTAFFLLNSIHRCRSNILFP